MSLRVLGPGASHLSKDLVEFFSGTGCAHKVRIDRQSLLFESDATIGSILGIDLCAVRERYGEPVCPFCKRRLESFDLSPWMCASSTDVVVALWVPWHVLDADLSLAAAAEMYAAQRVIIGSTLRRFEAADEKRLVEAVGDLTGGLVLDSRSLYRVSEESLADNLTAWIVDRAAMVGYPIGISLIQDSQIRRSVELYGDWWCTECQRSFQAPQRYSRSGNRIPIDLSGHGGSDLALLVQSQEISETFCSELSSGCEAEVGAARAEIVLPSGEIFAAGADLTFAELQAVLSVLEEKSYYGESVFLNLKYLGLDQLQLNTTWRNLVLSERYLVRVVHLLALGISGCCCLLDDLGLLTQKQHRLLRELICAQPPRGNQFYWLEDSEIHCDYSGLSLALLPLDLRSAEAQRLCVAGRDRLFQVFDVLELRELLIEMYLVLPESRRRGLVASDFLVEQELRAAAFEVRRGALTLSDTLRQPIETACAELGLHPTLKGILQIVKASGLGSYALGSEVTMVFARAFELISILFKFADLPIELEGLFAGLVPEERGPIELVLRWAAGEGLEVRLVCEQNWVRSCYGSSVG